MGILDRHIGGGTGFGISKNIRDCYNFIANNYAVGDDIFLFGFSRGATTVRSLASFIHLFGILPKARPELIKQAYKVYKISDKEKRDRLAEAFIDRHHTMWATIEFLGVWDTVAALGLPFKSLSVLVDKIPFFRHRFQDLRLPASVRNAYHALAIDDERQTFHPTMWDTRDLKMLKKMKDGKPMMKDGEPVMEQQNVKQVWFCGQHTDVGGGYAEHALSDIPLEWMKDMAVEHGLKIYREMEWNKDPNGFMHNARGSLVTRLYRRKVRSMNPFIHGKPTVHQSVLMRKLNEHNEMDPPYAPWILNNTYDYEIEPWSTPYHLRKAA